MNVVNPHKKISRQVTDADVERVVKDAKEMMKLILKPQRGRINVSMAHPQLDDKDPLRFFVVNPDIDIFKDLPEAIIVNPVITNASGFLTGAKVKSDEMCMTFPTWPVIQVDRYNKVTVEFQAVFMGPGDRPMISQKKYEMKLSGKLSKVFQHEIDHMNAKYIYKIIERPATSQDQNQESPIQALEELEATDQLAN